MSAGTPEQIESLVNTIGLKVGNTVNASTMLPTTASTPLFVDSSSKLGTGNIPFAMPMFAGTTDTSFSAMSFRGQATLTANDIMHQTLVAASGVTTFTSAGFIRVTVTDDAGNITNGSYYMQIGTLS